MKTDKQALKYAGWMGHEFVVIAGDKCNRWITAECTSLERAQQAAKESQYDSPTIYQKHGKGQWKAIAGV